MNPKCRKHKNALGKPITTLFLHFHSFLWLNISSYAVVIGGMRVHRLPHVRDMIDSLLKAKRAGSVASALSRRDKVLRYFEQVMDGEIETDQLKLKASELLGRGVNLFSTDITVNDTRQKDASELAGEIEALLLASQEEVNEPDILDPEDGEIH